jgi:hypothetical protein
MARSSTHRACFALLAANGSDDLRLRSSRAVQYLGSSETTPTRLVGASRVVRGVGDTRTLYAFGSCGATGSGTPCLGLIEWAAPRGGECTLDVDGDGQVLATTDGVLLTRIAAGMRGNAATANAVGSGTRQAWEAIRGMLARDCGMMIAP